MTREVTNKPKKPSKKATAKKEIKTLLGEFGALSQVEIVSRIDSVGRNTLLGALAELETDDEIKGVDSKQKNKKLYSLVV